MECLRSFVIQISQNRTFTNTATQIKNWGVIGNYHWVISQQDTSTFLIDGWKRIDIYGIEMLGSIQTTLGANDGAIVEDYQFLVGVTGQAPLVNGQIGVPNNWSISAGDTSFWLGKYSNKIFFETPISGVTLLSFNELKIQGNNGETLNSINLDIGLDFKFIYKFEGE